MAIERFGQRIDEMSDAYNPMLYLFLVSAPDFKILLKII